MRKKQIDVDQLIETAKKSINIDKLTEAIKKYKAKNGLYSVQIRKLSRIDFLDFSSCLHVDTAELVKIFTKYGVNCQTTTWIPHNKGIAACSTFSDQEKVAISKALYEAGVLIKHNGKRIKKTS